MKYRLTFCILLLLFVAGSMSLIMAQTPQWIKASGVRVKQIHG